MGQACIFTQAAGPFCFPVAFMPSQWPAEAGRAAAGLLEAPVAGAGNLGVRRPRSADV